MKRLEIILCILWIGFIFYNSSQPATISGGVTKVIVSSIKEVVEGEGDDLEGIDASYNNVSPSFKDVVKSIIFTVKTKISSWKNTSITNKVYNFLRKMAHGLEFFCSSYFSYFYFI